MNLTKEELMECLLKDGKVIGEESSNGNRLALDVVNAYKIWYSCPGDSASFVLCGRAYTEWKESKN